MSINHAEIDSIREALMPQAGEQEFITRNGGYVNAHRMVERARRRLVAAIENGKLIEEALLLLNIAGTSEEEPEEKGPYDDVMRLLEHARRTERHRWISVVAQSVHADADPGSSGPAAPAPLEQQRRFLLQSIDDLRIDFPEGEEG